MCNFASLSKSGPLPHQKALHSLAHRGPDGSGIYLSPATHTTRHRLLSIVDPHDTPTSLQQQKGHLCHCEWRFYDDIIGENCFLTRTLFFYGFRF